MGCELHSPGSSAAVISLSFHFFKTVSTKERVAGDLTPIAETINETKDKCDNEEENEKKIDAKENDDAKVSSMIAMQIVCIMPFFLKLSSTLPPLHLHVALVDNFGVSGPVAGIVMGMFQVA